MFTQTFFSSIALLCSYSSNTLLTRLFNNHKYRTKWNLFFKSDKNLHIIARVVFGFFNCRLFCFSRRETTVDRDKQVFRAPEFLLSSTKRSLKWKFFFYQAQVDASFFFLISFAIFLFYFSRLLYQKREVLLFYILLLFFFYKFIHISRQIHIHSSPFLWAHKHTHTIRDAKFCRANSRRNLVRACLSAKIKFDKFRLLKIVNY